MVSNVKKAALKSKRVCAFHGGKSTGPRTKAGKARLVQALTVHGGETRAMRREHSETVAYLRELEDVAWVLGMMTGTRTRALTARLRAQHRGRLTDS